MFNKSLNIWHSCFCFIIAIPWKITRKNNAKYLYTLKPWFNEQVRHMYLVCSLYRIIYYIKCKMLSKSSKWELDLVHYIAKFTISRFECIYNLLRVQTRCLLLILNYILPTYVGHPKVWLECLLAWSTKNNAIQHSSRRFDQEPDHVDQVLDKILIHQSYLYNNLLFLTMKNRFGRLGSAPLM